MDFNIIKRMFARIGLIGEINNNLTAYPVYVKSDEFGESTYYPNILEIKVNKDAKSFFLKDVGALVREKYFDFDFIFNVCFSCAKPEIFDKDKYADPYSIWFNVFFGYYQIDIPFGQRNYPFGFDENLNINPAEILKIGKSDWNFFSNYLYGVPLKVIENNPDAVNIGADEIDGCRVEKEVLNGVEFYKVTVDKFKVISGYESANDITLMNDFTSFVWQTLFGYPVSRKEFENSFFTSNMKAVMYVYAKVIDNDADLDGEKQYSTFIFGGVINLDYPDNALKNPDNNKTRDELERENERFLNLQLKEIKKIIPKVLET